MKYQCVIRQITPMKTKIREGSGSHQSGLKLCVVSVVQKVNYYCITLYFLSISTSLSCGIARDV